jgi:hypothetical protein
MRPSAAAKLGLGLGERFVADAVARSGGAPTVEAIARAVTAFGDEEQSRRCAGRAEWDISRRQTAGERVATRVLEQSPCESVGRRALVADPLLVDGRRVGVPQPEAPAFALTS